MKKETKKGPFKVPTKDVDAIMKKTGAKHALVILCNDDMVTVAKKWGKDSQSVAHLIQAIESVIAVVQLQVALGMKSSMSKSQSRRTAVQKKAAKKAVKKAPAKKKKSR